MMTGIASPVRVWVLAMLLVLTQTVALAHSHDDFTDAADLCGICVHGQHLDNALPTAHLPEYANTAQPVPAGLYQYRVVVAVLAAYSPRAPPLSL